MEKNPFADEPVFPEQEKNALSVVVMKVSKANIKEIADNIISDIKENDEDYLKAYVQAKALEEIAKAIIDGVKKDAMDEASNFEKDQKFEGCTVSVKNLPDKYSFESSEEWVRLTQEEARIKERKKKIEADMVLATTVSQLVNKDGEIIPPATLVNHGGQTISITLPKS